MESKKATVQVSLRYEWQEANPSRLRQAINDYLITALPGANYTSGTLLQEAGDAGEFEQQLEFNNIAGWLDALSEPALSYRLWLTQGTNSLSLTIGRGSLDVGLRGDASRAAEFKSHIQQFADSVGLQPKKQRIVPAPPVLASSFTRSGDYRLLDDVTADDWVKAMNLLRSWLGVPLTFNGSVALADDPGTTQEVRTGEAWAELVGTNWARLTRIAMTAFAPQRSANLRVQFADRTVNMTLTAEDSSAVREAFAAFESTLRLAPRILISADAALKGERRRYYTAQRINAVWVHETLLRFLRKTAVNRTGFGGTFRERDEEYTVNDFDAWAKEVERRWTEMQAAGCWITTLDSRRSVDVDFEREQVVVELRQRTSSGGPAVLTFADYELALGLMPAPAKPYAYYRFARRYQKVGNWDAGTDKALASAIDHAIVTAFGDHGPYVLMSASVTEGEAAQVQTTYGSKDAFLDRLRGGVPYVFARTYLQGPRGYDLGVQLLRSENKVVVRSTIHDAELFKKVAAPFNKIHDLEEYDSESRNASGEEETKKSNMPAWLTGIAALAAVLVSVLSLFITTTATTKSTLEILAPRDMADIPGKSCRVEWVVTRKTLWLGEVPEALRARVLVTKEGDQNYRSDTPDANSGMIVHFPSDGVYDVTVSARTAPARNVRVTVMTPVPAVEKATKKKPR